MWKKRVKAANFTKSSTLDAWTGSEYDSSQDNWELSTPITL